MADAIELLPDDLVTDAAQAFDRYRYAFDHDLLIQGGWHEERDGRKLACALGVLGGEVDDASKCPAQIMPRWLARLVPYFFDRLEWGEAKAWGLSLYEQLARLQGQVPFCVVYDWQANCLLEFWAGSLKKRKFDAETLAAKLADVEVLRALHHKHMSGGAAPRDEWREALRKIYRGRYAYADADADAYAYADAYADAYAYAYAYADADAYAYADADADAYAYAYAAGGGDKQAAFDKRKQENLKLMAEGLVAALSRAAVPEAAA